MMDSLKLFLITLAVPLVIGAVLIGPVLTLMSVNELAGSEVVPVTFNTYCSVLWLSMATREIFKRGDKE